MSWLLVGLTLAVTVHPLALLVREVAGERVRVWSLIPPGQSPHTYDPRPRDFARMEQADVLIAVGGTLDPWVRHPRRVDLMRVLGMDARANPHLWLSFRWAREAANALVDSLIRWDPEHADMYRQRLAAFHGRMNRLEQRYRDRFRQAPPVVLYHAAWTYLLEELGVQVVGVVEPREGYEPSPRALGELIRTIRSSGARVMILEPQTSRALLTAILSETDVDTVYLDPLGGVFPASTLSDLLEENLQRLARVLTP